MPYANDSSCIGRGLAWMHLLKGVARILLEIDCFELGEDMTDDDMRLIERGALAKPKSTKLWVQYKMKVNSRRTGSYLRSRNLNSHNRGDN